ncbi:hypothetical protein [Roseomonas sp. CAU 1739]|uniref:hypothetical protein n=1 Tax=Roseomonas sp. CAU 1739 TaxID=3140364 RepID=UPI00325B05D6
MSREAQEASGRGGRQQGVVAVLPRRGEAGRRVAWTPEEWPPVDAASWRRAVAANDGPRRRLPLDEEPSPAAAWATPTRKAAELAYGLWLAWLDLAGGLDPEEPAGVRVTPQRIDAFADFLRGAGYSETSVGFRLGKLTMALDAIDPAGAAARNWLRRFTRSLPGCKGKDRAIELAFKVSAGDLFALGLRLMEQARDLAVRPRAKTGLRAAVLHRDGLLITLQALLALRPRNLLGLEEGATLRRHDAGGGSPVDWQIAFPGKQMKAGRGHALPISAELAPHIEWHLVVHRPRLIAAGKADLAIPTTLFITDRGLPLGPAPAWAAVTGRVKAAFGVSVSIHEFRHVMASTVAIDAPGMMGVLPAALGHADERPVLDHYDLGTGLKAARRWQDALASERGEPVALFMREVAALPDA